MVKKYHRNIPRGRPRWLEFVHRNGELVAAIARTTLDPANAFKMNPMLKGNRKNPLQNHTFDSILGEGMVIDGRLRVSGSALIHGTVTGNIEADPRAELVVIGVGDSGSVQGNIVAHQVMIGGRVMGDVVASSRVELMSHAVVEGNLHYGSLVIDEGARVMGRMIPSDAADPALD